MTWLEGIITFLQVAAILSGASFAALALFTDYKKDGKVTRYGRMSVIGIAFSALCSLGTQWAQAKLADERGKAAATAAEGQRKQEAERFNAQIGRLNDVATSLGQLNGASQKLSQRAEESLRQLAAVQRRVGQSLFATQQIGQQSRRNTSRMLERMWVEGNRVGNNSVMAMVAYSCSTPPNEHVTLMPGEALAQVRILPAGASTIRYNPGEVSLISMDHQVSRFEMTGMIPFHQISRFTPFLLGEQFALQDPRQWANMSVYLDLTGVQPDPARSVRGATRATNEQRTQLRRSLGALSDYVEQARGVWIMPCSARYQLFLNGYEVASGEDGRLYLLEMGLVGNEARIVVQFSRVQVDMSEFPLLNLATLR